MEQLKDHEPIPPRRLAPELDRFLESVVMSALEKNPAHRYQSAAGFARDLRRALDSKGTEDAPAIGLSTRVHTWLKRNPLRAATCVWMFSLALVVGISAHLTLAGRAETLERDQQTNAAVAGMQAVAVNLQLRAYEQRIAELAQDPAIVAILDSTTPGGLSPTLLSHLAPFSTMFVIARDGRQRGRTSFKPPEYLARSFAFRDYFIGARRLGAQACQSGPASRSRRAHLARAFTSEADGHFEFAVSAPLCRGDEWAGVIGATVVSDKVLGAVRVLEDGHERIAAVLGPRDRDRKEAALPPPNDIHFIVHPGLAHGAAERLHHPSPTALRAALGIAQSGAEGARSNELRYSAPLRIDDYRDPISGFEGAWSAVFAAADESGFIVAVQSRRDVTPLARILLEKLALPAGVPFALALCVLIAVALTRRRTLRVTFTTPATMPR